MKVNGYLLAEKIKQTKSDVEMLTEQFDDNLTYFESDDSTKVDIPKVMESLQRAHTRLALLKAAQTQYNLKVKTSFQVEGRPASLFEAFSLLGVHGKIESHWTKAAKTKPGASRLYGGEMRLKDQEYAKKTVATDDAVKYARASSAVVGQLKASINAANMTETELDLPVSLLD